MCSCILYGYSHLPQAKIWASLGGPQLPIRSRRKIPLPEGTHLDLRLSHGKIGIILRCNPWAVGWCMFDRFSISDFGGKWPLKWKFSKMSFRIHRRNTEIRFVAKFGENWPLRCRKVVWITTQKKQEIRSVEHKLGVCQIQLFHFWSRDVHSVQNLLLCTTDFYSW